MKRVPYSDLTLTNNDKSVEQLDLPDFSDETCRLMESEPPTFQQQLAHADMLLRWRKAQSIIEDRMQGNPERFSL